MEEDNVRETAGLDLGDRWSHIYVVGEDGEATWEGRLRTTAEAFREQLGGRARMQVIIEAGGHSAWVERCIQGLGHKVVVANPRQLQLIARGIKKRDQSDAEILARLGRADERLLHPVTHRSERAQEALAMVRARKELVEARTGFINHLRGSNKALGGRLPACDARYFARTVMPLLSGPQRVAHKPMVEVIASLDREIAGYDREVERLVKEEFQDARLLMQVPGVGPLTALTFVLVIGSPERFRHSRDVAAYLGLVPARRQSGERDPQLGITKAGDSYLRSLLVESANYIMSSRSRPTDLKAWGTERWSEGDKIRRRKTKVALARKLAVLLHRLWVTGEVYEAERHGALRA